MKKVLSLVLAVVLVVGLGAVAFGAKLTLDQVTIGISGNLTATSATGLPVSPGNTEYTLWLTDGAGGRVTKADVTESKIGIQIRTTAGSGVVSGAKIVYETIGGTEFALVKVTFKGYYVSTSDQDFTIKLYPTVNKARNSKKEFTIDGTYSNPPVNVGAGEDIIYIADTPVVIADDYIKNIEVELGHNVSIFTRMFEGRKYYGRVSMDISTDDEAIMAKYPDIEAVYKLDTINLNATGDTVKFSLDDNMFIYVLNEDGELVYLGRSNDRVPYFTKYYLSAKELAVEEEIDTEEPEPEVEPTPEEGGPTGGDDELENVNDNPGTGR